MYVRRGWYKVLNENIAKTERYEGYKKTT
jgi:hypothetical protein